MYISVAEYIRRFGEYETRMFTNTNQEAPSATYDTAKVEAAISDADDEIDSYVSKRYGTPLESPPSLVVGWSAVIARLKLAEATGRVNEAIKDAAAFARRQLEQLAASKLNLPLPESGDAPTSVSTGDAMVSGDRDCPVFSGGGLRGFMEPFNGGSCQPNWMRD